MKIYGYSNTNSEGIIEMNEITISAGPCTLREVANFFSKCANEIEKDSDFWEDKHFKGNNTPQIVVFNQDSL